jgi:hypothetical protein
MPATEIDLETLIERELDAPTPAAVKAIAEAARLQHGDGIAAILFYGSCYRDGTVEDRLVDLYLLADDYRRVHTNRLSAWANALVPPNVYYLETAAEGETVRAKYALLTLDQLADKVRGSTDNPYFWARFAQPTGLVWCRDDAVRTRVIDILGQAVRTTFAAARALTHDMAASEALWTMIFVETYRTELRAEKPFRAAEIYQSAKDRYDRITRALIKEGIEPQQHAWARTRRRGKLWSVLRLMKAAFTFTAGADYLAWKIERHSGTSVELTDWQRRHPILASPPILWRLWRAKAVR